ncbi:hypothetical protein MMC08_008849 [Hypocenomyce scalaris]|nr:hypothetical protein [Hypocenomyce scalaris]
MSFAWDFNNVTHNLTFDGNMCATDVLDNWEAPDGLISDVTLEEIWEEISALDPDELYNYTLTTLQAESAQLNATYSEYFCSGPPVLNCEGRCLPSSASTTSEPPLRHAHLTTVMVRTAGVYLVALMVELFGEFFTTSHGGSAAVYAIVPVLVVFLNDYIIYLQRRGAVGRAEGYLASVYASTAGFIRQQAAGTTHGSCVQLANLEDIVVDPQSSSDGMSEISFMDALYESEMPSLRGDECV